ncbi:MAG TPA: DUF2142 domain-containing protein [Candidatus Saccharimonadales bacterium]|nr:DUF2142 domain-containing protein [Candidatus Saccharimonadales bacterium]
MAFDENNHLSIIRLYAHHLSPFWSRQPDGSAVFGAVSRDPSYMYHYLLSFYYRIIVLFTQSETIQVISLRLISVILFGLGLIIYRKVLLNTKAPRALVHVVLAIFVLTPVVPFLAAQINYDNLLFLMVAITLLLSQQIGQTLATHKTLDLKKFCQLIIALLFGSLVKYAFLPIGLGVAVVLVYQIWKTWFSKPKTSRFKSFVLSWHVISHLQQTLLVLIIVVLSGLFFERYGLNTIRYHTPTPECDQVLSVEKCRDNGSWLRNYQTHQDKLNHKLPTVSTNPINYTIRTWLKQISNDLFYTLNGSSSNFKTGQPYRLVRYLSVITIGIGSLCFIWWQSSLRKKYHLNLLIVVAIIYITTLWLQNYVDFVHLGLAVAIQGRYLIPVLPILYLLFGLGINKLFSGATKLKLASVILAGLILITQGGGIGVYILRSDSSWYWPNTTVNRLNSDARSVLQRLIIGPK